MQRTERMTPDMGDESNRWQHGDEVEIPGRPDRKNPHTFCVQYHTGAVKLYDRYGYPYRLDAEAAKEVFGG